MTPVKWVYSFLEKYRYKMAAGLLMVTGIVNHCESVHIRPDRR